MRARRCALLLPVSVPLRLFLNCKDKKKCRDVKAVVSGGDESYMAAP